MARRPSFPPEQRFHAGNRETAVVAPSGPPHSAFSPSKDDEVRARSRAPFPGGIQDEMKGWLIPSARVPEEAALSTRTLAHLIPLQAPNETGRKKEIHGKLKSRKSKTALWKAVLYKVRQSTSAQMQHPGQTRSPGRTIELKIRTYWFF